MDFKDFIKNNDIPNLKFRGNKFSSHEELVDYLLKHCKVAVNSKIKLWRGTRRNLPSGVYYPSSGTRASANTTNHYTMLFDSNPLNDKYPKRSNSFIATTAAYIASGYGYVYRIFPEDNTMIGVVNKTDFWHLQIPVKFSDRINSSKKGIGVNRINSIWERFWIKVHGSLDYTPTIDQAIKDIKANKDKILDMIPLVGNNDKQDEKNFDDFVKQLPQLYCYDNLGCELLKIDKIYPSIETEVWFSDPAVMVGDEDLIEVNKLLKEKM